MSGSKVLRLHPERRLQLQELICICWAESLSIFGWKYTDIAAGCQPSYSHAFQRGGHVFQDPKEFIFQSSAQVELWAAGQCGVLTLFFSSWTFEDRLPLRLGPA